MSNCRIAQDVSAVLANMLRRRYMSKLDQHPQVVPHTPVFDNLPVTQPREVHLLHREVLPGDREHGPAAKRQWSVLGPREGDEGDNLVIFREQCVDRVMQIGERCAPILDDSPELVDVGGAPEVGGFSTKIFAKGIQPSVVPKVKL